MSWIQIRYTTDKESAEAISDHMTGTGAAAVTFLDAADTPIYEPLPGDFFLWEATTVMGLYPADIDTDKVLKRLKNAKAGNKGFYKVEQLEDKDWVREWMDSFQPMQFGKRLWICPSWRDVPDSTAVNVMLDPGLAFGTGTHPTTSLCLRWLDENISSDQTVVDFGCGSGILAIAALKLGAKRTIGIDIDPQAIVATEENAKRNNVEKQIELFLPKDQPEIEADVVVANILAAPLRELSEVITAFVKPGGKLALSGILDTQAEEIVEIYSQWFDMDPVANEEEWCRVSGTRKQ
ncbi:50S ribosomal protein L11 methyltransferase [Catenovulum sp. SM1970]|uniref:50S ribosomal protein L11 methyltransferase n=1 Tax=Marinifaba aquimaris TaxID=2741323 RepID=UPI0015728E33|nr:50S ribosomal protein L11 methyltransferase [Marinifaba aquimaris]NTS76498.1 50S ribosomal protein L11 methyltransferase [Marinifaba aquimaris]